MNEELEPGDGAPIGSEWKIDVIDRTDGSAASEKRLAEVAGYVLRDEGVEHAEISVAVVDDLEMARLHADFLQIDGPTDVLTFPLEGDSLEAWTGPVDARRGSGRRICGEVVIGGDTAMRVAGEVGSLPSEEVILYLVHGLLHLCGYDDLDDLQRDQMRSREAELLDLLEVTARADG